MSNMLIAYKNHTDDGSFSAGSWEATLPLTNLINRQVAKVARSTDAAVASTKMDLDLGSSKSVRLIGAVKHNLTQDATWRVRVSQESDFSTTVYDSGWVDAWPDVSPFGSESWGEFEWGGKLPAADAATYGLASWLVTSSAVLGRYVRIEFSDTANTDGYVQVGRIVVAAAWQPTDNLEYGWTIEQVDPSRIVRSRSGNAFVDVIPKYRRLTFSIGMLSEDEMFGQAYEMDRIVGMGGDVVVMIDPDNTTHQHRQTIYGMISEMTPIEQPLFERFRKDFVVEELV